MLHRFSRFVFNDITKKKICAIATEYNIKFLKFFIFMITLFTRLKSTTLSHSKILRRQKNIVLNTVNYQKSFRCVSNRGQKTHSVMSRETGSVKEKG